MDHERTPQAPAAQSQTVEGTASHRERVQIVIPGPGDGNGVSGHDTTRSQTSSAEQHLLSAAPEGYPTHPRSNDNPYADFERIPPPTRSRDGRARAPSNRQGALSTIGLPAGNRNNSGIDWIVPKDEKDHVSVTLIFRICQRHGYMCCPRRAAP